MRKLYLMEMGCNDKDIKTDLQNHRVRVLENIDIVYKGKFYNMFFEFTTGNHWKVRTTNKRNGQPLKKPITETILRDALFVDTQFEKTETDSSERAWEMSYSKTDLERENWEKHYKYTRENVLKVINTYAIEKYNKVILCEEEAKNIINRVGGFREKDILNDFYMQKGDTWTEEHKIIKVCKRDNSSFCEVDLETGKITG